MQSARSPLWTWLALGPMFLVAGVAVGSWLQSGRGEPQKAAPPEPRIVALPSLAPLVEQVRGAVVGVRTVHLAEVKQPETTQEAAHADDGQSFGTGVVYDGAGLVLTAHHLVTQAARIEIELPAAGGTRTAQIVGDDPTTDLAVLRIVDPPRSLVSVGFAANEDVQQGDWVFTVGNPATFHSTVSAGIVGYVDRHLRQDGLALTNEYLQISGPVNPGSSGSPVFDLHGRMIGITTRAAVDADGMGFALGIRTIRNVLAAMERDAGRVRRAHLGISCREAERDRASDPDHEHVAIVVTDVAKGLPAEHAGLQVGDLIVRFDAQPLVSVADFYERVTWSRPGREVSLDVVRGGRRLGPVTVELGELRLPDSSQPQ
ncbi:MAG: trypsin-like peptidase domain-containing protein [Planctomycetota bacterium]